MNYYTVRKRSHPSASISDALAQFYPLFPSPSLAPAGHASDDNPPSHAEHQHPAKRQRINSPPHHAAAYDPQHDPHAHHAQQQQQLHHVHYGHELVSAQGEDPDHQHLVLDPHTGILLPQSHPRPHAQQQQHQHQHLHHHHHQHPDVHLLEQQMMSAAAVAAAQHGFTPEQLAQLQQAGAMPMQQLTAEMLNAANLGLLHSMDGGGGGALPHGWSNMVQMVDPALLAQAAGGSGGGIANDVFPGISFDAMMAALGPEELHRINMSVAAGGGGEQGGGDEGPFFGGNG